MPTRLLIIALLAVTASLQASDDSALALGPRALGGALVGDPLDPETPVCEVNSAKGAKATFENLPAGVYDVEVQGRFLCAYIATFSLGLAVQNNGRTVAGETYLPNTLPTAGATHPIVLAATMPEGGTLTVDISLNAKLSPDQQKAFERLQLQKMAKPKLSIEVNMGQDDGEDFGALEDVFGTPSGQPAFLVHRVILRPRANAFVARIHPSQIHYYPDDEVAVDVAIGSAVEQDLRMQVDVVTAVHDEWPLLDETLAVGAGKQLARTLRFKPKVSYGHEIRVRLSSPTAPATILHERSEYFGVSENMFEISIASFSRFINRPLYAVKAAIAMSDAAIEERARVNAQSVRRSYANHLEVFSWAPDDFFNLAPEGDGWWSGTMGYPVSRRTMVMHIAALKAEGIKVLTYAQPYAVGTDTVRELRRKPEFFAYAGNGAPAVAYDYDTLKAKSRLGPFGKRTVEVGGRLNFVSLATVDRGIDAAIASSRMFGFDGIRYDNRYYRASNVTTWDGTSTNAKNLDDLSARNVKRLKTRFWKEIGPRFLISHNNGYRFRKKGNIKGWDETVSDGLMCMDEESQAASRSRWPWSRYFGLAVEARRKCTELGGYYQYFPPGRGTSAPIDMIYYPVVCAASGSHPTADVESPPTGHYGRFFTRYSALIWSKHLKPVLDPQSLIAPMPGERNLWWQDYAHRLELDGRRWTCFGLVVPPLQERVNSDLEGRLPEPLPPLTVQLPDAAWPAAGARVFALTAERAAMRTDLTIAQVDGGRQVVVPSMRFFTLLVVEETDAP
jgi:hypothetical protein